MKISIEKRDVAGDKQSLRLVYYYGHTTDADGKIIHQRKRETLDLFLYSKPKTALEKQHNKEVNQLAEAIKAKRIVEAQAGKHGFSDSTKGKADFFDFLDAVVEEKRKTSKESSVASLDTSFSHFKRYIPQSIQFDQITPEVVSGFADYLKNLKTQSGQSLSPNTQKTYFEKVTQAISRAVKKGYMSKNPCFEVEGIDAVQGKRVYLTLEELRALAKTECRNDILKRAFLFSCLTGLRWSDVTKLKWSDVHTDDGQHRIIFNQTKTSGLQYLDIPDQAYRYLGEKNNSQERIFNINYSNQMNQRLFKWAFDAGVNKALTFHSGRHTFAVTQLAQGTQIYTLSRLMGHGSIATTMIYADILDKDRRNAMNSVPNIEL